jgi:acyl carrier protein phosphodiesterase
MNFLAHLFVSDPTPEAMLGNAIADFVARAEVARLPAAVQAGVRQHRRVDAFTDRHPRVQRAITRISARWGWFSGIVLDVYFDHVLARDWHRYTAEPLREFADRCNAILRTARPYLAPTEHWLPDRFTADDRLFSYRTVDGIHDALRRVSARVAARIPNRALPLADALPDLLAADAGISADFHAFFPELVEHARTAGPADASG